MNSTIANITETDNINDTETNFETLDSWLPVDHIYLFILYLLFFQFIIDDPL